MVRLTSPVRRGAKATVNIRTAPRAECDIEVVYRSGRSTAQGLHPKTANARGLVGWTWTVGTRTTPGEYPIHIDCETDDDWEDITLYFTVR